MKNLTLKKLQKENACIGGYNNFVLGFFKQKPPINYEYHSFASNEKFTVKDILETNGVHDAFWSFNCLGKKHYHTLNKLKIELTTMFLKPIIDKKLRRACKHLLNDAKLFIDGNMSVEEYQSKIKEFKQYRTILDVTFSDYCVSYAFSCLDSIVNNQKSFGCIDTAGDFGISEEDLKTILLKYI